MNQYPLVFWWNFQSELASISNQIFPYMAKCSARTTNFFYQYCMYCGFFTVRCVFYSCCIYWKWSCQDNKKRNSNSIYRGQPHIQDLLPSGASKGEWVGWRETLGKRLLKNCSPGSICSGTAWEPESSTSSRGSPVNVPCVKFNS